MTRLLLVSLTACMALALMRCTDPTVIGGDLLDSNQLPIAFTDTLPISLSTTQSTPSQITSFSVGAGAFAVGCIDDPVFGNTTAKVGFELIERDSTLNLFGATIDSVVLVLPLHPARQLGDTTAEVSLQVLQAAPGTLETDEKSTADPLDDTGVIYGTFTGVPPRAPTSVNFFTPDSIRVDSVNPQLRIALNQQFIDDIRPALNAGASRDTIDAFQDSVFAENFAGIILAPTGCSATLPAVSVLGSNGGRFGVTFFYTRDSRQFQYTLSFFRSGASNVPFRPVYTHNYAGSLAEEVLAGTGGDSIALVQSLDGLATRVDLSSVTTLGNVAVNFATLEIPVIRDDFTDPVVRLVARRRNSVGDFVSISAASTTGDGTFELREGGTIVRAAAPLGASVDSIDVYRINLTSYIQRIANGERDPEVYLLPFGQVQLGGRSILAGANFPDTPARLLLATTRLPN